MKQIVILVITLLCYVNIAIPQSKKLMYEDFDELITIIEECNPQLAIRKAITGVDHLQMVKDLRQNIDTITDIYSFEILIMKALYYLYDIHAHRAYSLYDFEDSTNIDVNAIRLQNKQQQQRWMQKEMCFDPYRFFCNPVYVNGNYYLQGCYQFSNPSTGSSIQICDPMILSYNGIDFKNYVLKDQPFNIRWDHKRKCYYSILSVFPKRNTLELFNTGKEETVSINLDIYQDITITSPPKYAYFNKLNIPAYSPSANQKVIYVEKEKVLYIYLRNMEDDQGKFAARIKKLGSDKIIDKIIIDVRDNQGGNDLAWHYLLKAILKDSLLDQSSTALNNSKMIKKIYRSSKIVSNIDQWEVKQFDCLPGQEFLFSKTMLQYLIPDSNSLKYNGKIYILQNEYTHSSAQAFASFAKNTEQLITVGVPTGMLGGRGIAPELFQLSNSKIAFRLETLLDLTNVKELIDVFQDFPEIEIDIPDHEMFIYYYSKRLFDQQSENYLLNHDYLFKEVLKLQ